MPLRYEHTEERCVCHGVGENETMNLRHIMTLRKMRYFVQAVQRSDQMHSSEEETR